MHGSSSKRATRPNWLDDDDDDYDDSNDDDDDDDDDPPFPAPRVRIRSTYDRNNQPSVSRTSHSKIKDNDHRSSLLKLISRFKFKDNAYEPFSGPIRHSKHRDDDPPSFSPRRSTRKHRNSDT